MATPTLDTYNELQSHQLGLTLDEFSSYRAKIGEWEDYKQRCIKEGNWPGAYFARRKITELYQEYKVIGDSRLALRKLKAIRIVLRNGVWVVMVLADIQLSNLPEYARLFNKANEYCRNRNTKEKRGFYE